MILLTSLASITVLQKGETAPQSPSLRMTREVAVADHIPEDTAQPTQGILLPYAPPCPPGGPCSDDTPAFPPILSETGTTRNSRVR